MEKKYKTVKIDASIIEEAKRQKTSVNKYILNMKNMVSTYRTTELNGYSTDIQDLKEAVKSLSEAIGYQRYMIDTQTKNQNKKIDSLIDMQQKLINAYAADIEFIDELKKMVLKGE